jgi:hypothetical protein
VDAAKLKDVYVHLAQSCHNVKVSWCAAGKIEPHQQRERERETDPAALKSVICVIVLIIAALSPPGLLALALGRI